MRSRKRPLIHFNRAPRSLPHRSGRTSFFPPLNLAEFRKPVRAGSSLPAGLYTNGDSCVRMLHRWVEAGRCVPGRTGRARPGIDYSNSALRAQARSVGQWTTLPRLMPINPVHSALAVTQGADCVGISNMRPRQFRYRPRFRAKGRHRAVTAVGHVLQWHGGLSDGRVFVNGGNLQ
jgi:hypothetical protein